jgi:hypothetical protein
MKQPARGTAHFCSEKGCRNTARPCRKPGTPLEESYLRYYCKQHTPEGWQRGVYWWDYTKTNLFHRSMKMSHEELESQLHILELERADDYHQIKRNTNHITRLYIAGMILAVATIANILL